MATSLANVSDNSAVRGREKLRDVAAQAITKAWKHSRPATCALAKQVNGSSHSLLQDEFFNAVGHRVYGILQVNSFRKGRPQN
ncbi:unnamed protein product [Strongylus vulgaris]|uniref:Uncharacterized protein n=1 Tax=Strongylus vulgaris TaxID=40348 RepID=A0A3P7JCV6_STRVU|nr:unnamed protein product [Strongylus vulgaris]